VRIFIPSPAADERSVSGVGNVQNRDDYLRNSLPMFFVPPPPRTISHEVASGVYDVRIYTTVAVDEIASIIYYYNVMRIELDVCADSKTLLCIFQRLIISIIVSFEIQNNNTRPARFQ